MRQFWIPLCLLLSTGTPLWAKDRVDLALVLAADISFSVGPYELDLQRRGYVDALQSDAVITAVTSGHYGRIAVAYIEWGDDQTQNLILPWTIIDSASSARAAARRLRNAPLQRSGATSISAALETARALFRDAPPALRWVIDLSADGYNNSGDDVTHARARAVRDGITINGLPIENSETQELTAYFRDCVAEGLGAFVMPVATVEDFGKTLLRKMVLEISVLDPILIPVKRRAPVPCDIGERQSENAYDRQIDDLTKGHPDAWRWRRSDKH